MEEKALKRCVWILILALLLCGCGASDGPLEEDLFAADLPVAQIEEAAPPTEAPTETATETEAETVTEPEPTEDPTLEASLRLSQLLTTELDGCPGVWSVCVRHLGSGVQALYHDRPMVAASLIKLQIAGAYFAAVRDGRIADSERELVRSMLSRSDNDACNRLIALLGMEQINEFIRQEGFADTQLNRKMLERTDLENYTSPLDCTELLARVLAHSFVSEEASAEILDALLQQERTGKLPEGVPVTVKTANKTGELADTENDAAIFWTEDGIYLVCVMASGLEDTEAARNEIVRLSTEIYKFFQSESERNEVEAHE